MPLVDAIDGDTYVFSPQAGGDENGFARGAWDWLVIYFSTTVEVRRFIIKL